MITILRFLNLYLKFTQSELKFMFIQNLAKTILSYVNCNELFVDVLNCLSGSFEFHFSHAAVFVDCKLQRITFRVQTSHSIKNDYHLSFLKLLRYTEDFTCLFQYFDFLGHSIHEWNPQKTLTSESYLQLGNMIQTKLETIIQAKCGNINMTDECESHNYLKENGWTLTKISKHQSNS